MTDRGSRSGTTLFGWCLPGSKDHGNCVSSFTYGERLVRCGCTCHNDPVATPRVRRGSGRTLAPSAGEPATGGYPTMGGGFTHLCNACPVTQEAEDQTGEGDTSDEFGDFIRTAMQSFGIDPDAWLEEQDRLEAERAAES